MSEFLRHAHWALLGAALGCSRPAQTSADAGAAATADERPLHTAAPAAEPLATLEGRVRWLGPRPSLPALETSSSVRSVCGAQLVDNSFQVDSSGGVAEVVVWVESPAEAARGPELVLDQRGCLYRPAVLAARAGGTLRIRNSDPLTHTVHALEGSRTLFDVAMPLEHMELSRTLPAQPGVVDILCDVHPWMRAVVRTFEHSHFTSTAADGRFQLPGLEPGEVRVHAWHPRLGEASRRLQVRHGVTATEFDFGAGP